MKENHKHRWVVKNIVLCDECFKIGIAVSEDQMHINVHPDFSKPISNIAIEEQ